MFDFDNPKKEAHGLKTLCQCGYSRDGLNQDSLCPECGELDLMYANLSLKEHWKYANNASRTAFVLAAISTLIIGACSLFWVWFFQETHFGGTAGMALLYPMAGLVVSLPLALITIIFALTQCFTTFSKIARISVWTSVVSGIYPGIVIFISTDKLDGIRYVALLISLVFLLIAAFVFIVVKHESSRVDRSS